MGLQYIRIWRGKKELICLFVFAEDVKRLNEKLSETSKAKMELQLKLDEIQSSEVSIQVHTLCQDPSVGCGQLFKGPLVWNSINLK